MMDHTETTGDLDTIDGVLVAPVDERGMWHALSELREAMRGLSQRGRARTSFLATVDDEGRLVPGHLATALVMGYRIEE